MQTINVVPNVKQIWVGVYAVLIVSVLRIIPTEMVTIDIVASVLFYKIPFH